MNTHVHVMAPTLKSIKAPKVLEHIAGLRSGLVLVGGQTGSGCSTTLAAILDRINKTRAAKVVTLEECIEFQHADARSTLIRHRMKWDEPSAAPLWAEALLDNPDIIVVDNKRTSVDDVRMALKAADKSRLVLMSVHSQSSVIDALSRIIQTFPRLENSTMLNLLARNLQAVIAQVMLPTVVGKNVVAHEILMADAATREMLTYNNLAGLYDHMHSNDAAYGTQSLRESIADLVESGVVSQAKSDMHIQYNTAHCRVA